jgi:hypothetical protein
MRGLTMPFSRQLKIADTRKDTVAVCKVVSVRAATPGELVDIWRRACVGVGRRGEQDYQRDHQSQYRGSKLNLRYLSSFCAPF